MITCTYKWAHNMFNTHIDTSAHVAHPPGPPQHVGDGWRPAPKQGPLTRKHAPSLINQPYLLDRRRPQTMIKGIELGGWECPLGIARDL